MDLNREYIDKVIRFTNDKIGILSENLAILFDITHDDLISTIKNDKEIDDDSYFIFEGNYVLRQSGILKVAQKYRSNEVIISADLLCDAINYINGLGAKEKTSVRNIEKMSREPNAIPKIEDTLRLLVEKDFAKAAL